MVTARRKPRPSDRSDDVAPRFDTVPDVVRRLRRLTEACGGDHFAVLLIVAGERKRLAPALDSDYPGLTARTARLADALGEQAMRRVTESTRPFWWSGDPASPAALSLSRCLWAERTAPPGATGTSVALPLAAERDEGGLMVVSGERMAFTMASLTELHASCLSLFGIVARLKPALPDAPPSMSRRQIECLRLSANGHTSEEIAARLGLSVHTTTQYLSDCAGKLDAVNRVHAIAKALRLGLID